MNGHPRDQAKVSVHCRWPLIRGNLTLKCVGRGIDNVAVQGRWPLTTGVAQGRYYCSVTQCNILLSMCPSSLLFLTCPYHFSMFSVIFFVIGATFADPLTFSFLIVSFFGTPQSMHPSQHPHLIHLQSLFLAFRC